MKLFEMTDSSVLGITNGPSKEMLSLVLFNRTKLKKQSVEATTDHGEKIRLSIDSIEREDDSDESFNIKATAWKPHITDCVAVMMYYRTDERAGKLRLRK